jgi:hypothetical protein
MAGSILQIEQKNLINGSGCKPEPARGTAELLKTLISITLSLFIWNGK